MDSIAGVDLSIKDCDDGRLWRPHIPPCIDAGGQTVCMPTYQCKDGSGESELANTFHLRPPLVIYCNKTERGTQHMSHAFHESQG